MRKPALIVLGLLSFMGSVACSKSQDAFEPAEPDKKYAALGDSFVTGDGGIRPEQPGDPCKRDADSYPRILAKDFRTAWQLTHFAACSGATTANLRDQQVSVLSGDLDYVTLTVGGNDMGFSRFVQLCVLGNCSDSVQNRQFFDGADNVYQPLVDLYRLVLSKAPNAKIYVTNYPQIVAHHCDILANAGVTPEEVITARSLTDDLNTTIGSAISDIGDDRLVLVDMTAPGSALVGNSICQVPTAFHAIVPHNLGASFHPNNMGQMGFAAAIREKHLDN